jgi:transcriptional regulator with XRE-family HTH domain
VSDDYDYNSVDQYVGARICERRVALGLSQSELGAKIDVTFQQVQKYEKGTNRVSASRLFRIAEVLRMNVAEFFPVDGAQARSAGKPMTLKGVDGAAVTRQWPELSAGRQKLVRQMVDELAND